MVRTDHDDAGDDCDTEERKSATDVDGSKHQRDRNHEQGVQQHRLGSSQRCERNCDADQDCFLDVGPGPEAVDGEEHQRDRQRVHRLGQQHLVVRPQLWVHGREPGCDQPRPRTCEAAADEPDHEHGSRTRAARTASR